MPIDIVVPELGESITEATVAAWLAKPGEAVRADQPIVELETDKATLEIAAPKAGVLTEVLVPEGEDVLVGAVLARIDESAAATSTAPAPTAAPAPAAAPLEATDAAAATEHAAGLDPSAISRSGAGGRVTLADLQRFLGVDTDRIGPAARKWIADHGLDPGEVPASGRDGRITKGDVIDFLERRAAADAGAGGAVTAAATAVSDVGERREERVKMTRMRRTIAARLKEAQNTAAILTTFNQADMSAVVALRKLHREAFEQRHAVRLGFNSFFVKAAVAALREIPQVNAEIDGEEIVYKHYFDVGIAVASPSGLVVPVVRDCEHKSFAEIEKSVAELAGKARDGSLTMDEMSGGTFSITNGGVFGSMLSTPILNRPQSAILGLHRIEDRPMAVDGEVVIRPMMYLALSYDHRIVDGREAVTFLVRIVEAIEDPSRLMLDL